MSQRYELLCPNCGSTKDVIREFSGVITLDCGCRIRVKHKPNGSLYGSLIEVEQDTSAVDRKDSEDYKEWTP